MSGGSPQSERRRAGLLGRTLGHSLSPRVHRFFGDYGYALYEREPQDVESFLRTAFADGSLGFLNVTIPYKKTVFALCDEVSPLARRLGNVNFVCRRPDGSLFGDNTDATGVRRLLASVAADVRGLRCAILGAGGAALTTQAVLEEEGAASVALVRRGEEPAADTELIVNATPVGMWPDTEGRRLDIARWTDCRYVLDLVYNPSPTRLVREARAAGKRAADGRVMLLAQAYRAACLAGLADFRNLYLYGPPASGKSRRARELAAALGWRRVDLDEAIVRRAHRTIPEIFAAEGEGGFRRRERDEVLRVTAADGQVVALGGGALLNAESRRLVEQTGRVVCLDCAVDTLAARLTSGSRPLAGGRAALERLLETRRAHYASFPVRIDVTDPVPPAETNG